MQESIQSALSHLTSYIELWFPVFISIFRDPNPAKGEGHIMKPKLASLHSSLLHSLHGRFPF